MLISAASFFFGVFSFLLFLPTELFAFSNPQNYYDWTGYNRANEVLGVRVFAQEESTSSGVENQEPVSSKYLEHRYLVGFASDYSPDNPLYYLIKRPEEFITRTFTFNSEKKSELLMELAGERLSEMEAMAEEGNVRPMEMLSGSYNRTTDLIAQRIEKTADDAETADLVSKVDLEFAKHTLVLEEVALQAPEQAEQGLRTAISSSERVVDTVADAMGRPAIPAEVMQRLQSLKAQGILSPEEVNKLVGAGSRREAREELRKYTEARLFPESDFKKLDETARVYFPQDYYQAVEIKKFRELKDLETQRPDDATLARVQEYAKEYEPGDVVPAEIRRWWVPMVRLEELQNTIRPDLIPEEIFKYRPDDQQKFREVIERAKPRAEDVAYVNNLAKTNPDILNDPAYSRIVSIGNMFGTASGTSENKGQKCLGGQHWVDVAYMPNGGYCISNYEYPAYERGSSSAVASCPPQFHRNSPDGPCYPDSSNTGIGEYARAQQGACPSGYHWVSASPSGYCSSDYPRMGSGSFPGPVSTPTYCPSGMFFGPGGVCTPNDKSSDAYNCSQSGKYWDGASCQNSAPSPSTEYPAGSGSYSQYSPSGVYQGEGSGSTSGCNPPAGACASGGWFDWGSCSCKTSSQSGGGSYSGGQGCMPPASGCPGGYWDGTSCSCRPSTSGGYQTPQPYSGGYQQPTCGSGFYWNGNSCVQSGGTQSSPSTTTNTYTQTAPPPAETGGGQPPSDGSSGPAPAPPPAENPPTSP